MQPHAFPPRFAPNAQEQRTMTIESVARIARLTLAACVLLWKPLLILAALVAARPESGVAVIWDPVAAAQAARDAYEDRYYYGPGYYGPHHGYYGGPGYGYYGNPGYDYYDKGYGGW